MPRVCAVDDCRNSEYYDNGKTFHRFPRRRPHVLLQWLKNLNKDKSWMPGPRVKLCSDHFTENCFKKTGKYVTLSRDAVPTIFPKGSHKRTLSRAIMMKAVKVETFGGPEVLKVKSDVPIPQPAEDEVLVRMKAIGINPVETYIRAGTHILKPSLPYTPGSDGAGLVEKVGTAVTKFKAGDRVFVCRTVSGSYAEYATVKATSTNPLPALLDFKQGAALGIPYFTAYRALCIRGKIQAGRSILIHGASGAVGNACIQISKSYGLTVFGTAGSQLGLDLIKRLGVDQAFNHRKEGYEKEIMAATGDKGVDYIAEMLSNVNLQKDLELLTNGGTALLIGSRGNISVTPRTMMAKEINVMGVMLGHSTKEEFELIGSEVVKGIEAGHLAPVIAKEYPLDGAAEAHRDIINTTSAAGKLVLVL